MDRDRQPQYYRRMNKDAFIENRHALEQLVGLEVDKAEKLLGSFVLITSGGDLHQLETHIGLILGKTFEGVDTEVARHRIYSCEIIIAGAAARTAGPYVYAGYSKTGNPCISRIRPQTTPPGNLNGFVCFLMACYIGGTVLRSILGEALPLAADEEIHLDIARLIGDEDIFKKEVDLGEVYLAGAGAVGNALVYALQFFNVTGTLIVADPDIVDGGNLNRCLFFTEEDIDHKKVDVLVNHAQRLFKGLALHPFPDVLKQLPEAKKGGAWLRRLIVAVDSRRARRHLQSEIPGEVFDASTTDISEVVLHYNKQPLESKACLGCVYPLDTTEQAHERHVAEKLGVTIEQINQGFIDEVAEQAIKRQYPELTGSLIGFAYDTLFKRLCAEGKLTIGGSKQVFAPLAFVSSLAGAMLAVMVVKNSVEASAFNYWRLSPWCNPNYRLQQNLITNERCNLCNESMIMEMAARWWKGDELQDYSLSSSSA